LPSVPPKVRLLNRLPTLDLGAGTTLLAPKLPFAACETSAAVTHN